MARNLELKVRCTAAEQERARDRALGAGASDLVELRQRDTYFVVAQGRLKLRQIETGGIRTAELIQYSRPDVGGMRLSRYRRTEIDADQAGSLEASLEEALGLLTVVEKMRCLLILGTTRIHLDEVTGLGHFIELETVLGEAEGELERGQAEYDRIVAMLGLGALEPVPGSYSDLMLGRESSA